MWRVNKSHERVTLLVIRKLQSWLNLIDFVFLQEKENLCNLEKKYSSLSGGKGFPVTPNTLKEVSCDFTCPLLNLRTQEMYLSFLGLVDWETWTEVTSESTQCFEVFLPFLIYALRISGIIFRSDADAVCVCVCVCVYVYTLFLIVMLWVTLGFQTFRIQTKTNNSSY